MTQTVRPQSGVGTNNHGVNPSGTVSAALGDQSDVTYCTGNSATPDSGLLPAVTDPVSSVLHVINYRIDRTTGTGGPTISLYQGDPAGAGVEIANSIASGTTGIENRSYTLSGAEADAITNYAQLYWYYQKSSGTATYGLYEIWFDFPDAPAPPFVGARQVIIGTQSGGH